MTHDLRPNAETSDKKSAPAPKKPSARQRRQTSCLAWLADPFNHSQGETSLWIAVITQAMMDALTRADHPEARHCKNEAIRWLSDNGPDFIQVCLNAGFDPDYVRRKAKRTLLFPVSWRAEAGKGDRYLERREYRRRVRKYLESEMQKIAHPRESTVITGCWGAGA